MKRLGLLCVCGIVACTGAWDKSGERKILSTMPAGPVAAMRMGRGFDEWLRTALEHVAARTPGAFPFLKAGANSKPMRRSIGSQAEARGEREDQAERKAMQSQAERRMSEDVINNLKK